MSAFGFSSSVLTLRPTIVHDRDRLVIQSGWLSRMVVLFLLNRKVEIFFNQRLVVYSNTRFLFFRKTRIIGFDQLSHIDYTYGSIGRSWGWTGSGIGRYDSLESFAIALITKQKERLDVCAFRGRGRCPQDGSASFLEMT